MRETRVADSTGANGQCILCGSGDVHTIDQFPFRDLRQLYFETCEVDISTCLDTPYERALVYLYECGACGLEFFPTSLRGNVRLYEALARFDYYYMADKWEFGIALEDVRDSKTILEVGCGNGCFLDQVTKAYPEKKLMGLELNLDALRVCREKGLAVQAKPIDEFSNEHADSFDAVCAFQVLEHVEDPRGFLEAAFRCLKDGGLCILSVPNSCGFTQYAINDFGNMPPHHLTRWAPSVMQKTASRYRVSVQRILLEQVAEYHKEWYRDAMTVRALSAVLGLHWKRVERSILYRVVLALCRRFQRCLPSQLWRYRRYAGHTLYVAFRKGARGR